MPIFRVKDALHVFAHVPKCAGTTIEAHLTDRFGPLGLIGNDGEFSVSLQHLTWTQIQSILPEYWIAGSFAVVRHPFDRFVSGYNMRISQASPPFPRETTITDFLDWAEVRLSSYPNLLDNHLRSQVDFIGPDTTLFHFENGLDAVVAYLDTTFGVRSDLPPLGHHDYHDPQTEKLFDIAGQLPNGVANRLVRLYAEDFAQFGYDTSPDRPVKLKVLKPEYANLARRIVWQTQIRLRMAMSGRGGAR